MAQVFAPPSHIPCPAFNLDRKKNDDAQAEFLEKLKAFCVEQGSGDCRGEEIGFPIADGKARYMIFSNTKLIHLELNDAYQIPDAHARGLRAADIKKHVERDRAMAKLFGKQRVA